MGTQADDIQGLALRLVPALRAWFAPHSQRARIYKAADQTIATGTVTTVLFDSQRYDTASLSAGGIMTAPAAGDYRMGAHIRFAANATGQRGVYLQHNSSTYIAIDSRPAVIGGWPTDVTISCEYRLAAGDTVRVQVFQDSGGDLNILAGPGYGIEMWISAL
jgi:hypothetical protein